MHACGRTGAAWIGLIAPFISFHFVSISTICDCSTTNKPPCSIILDPSNPDQTKQERRCWDSLYRPALPFAVDQQRQRRLKRSSMSVHNGYVFMGQDFNNHNDRSRFLNAFTLGLPVSGALSPVRSINGEPPTCIKLLTTSDPERPPHFGFSFTACHS